MEKILDPIVEPGITLYRAVGLNEARDLEAVRRFRLHRSPGFDQDKRFATTEADAGRWGRRMQDFSFPRPFRIASVRISAAVVAAFYFLERLDGIGPAYYVESARLSLLNRATTSITVSTAVYEVEAGQ